ncbi:hypothetical protein P152DRAFT_515401 [Eremomyces bilateralis CBS 781.70]|uniref:WD40 repeat-like protein n=1 Tax=Eremomyces bilateralis CBS 781.70 TaxID=1392243 RepID=A0A6G1FYX9_9PEZI|nr:uncharacterized protein P152DRAFT_515401 [Eremomyces bilateralis CBS 781.70]KAF1810993.1 hypothetical protein P152DRAFT_515401 [Eremomyces bilateralis CBS 781.70]
MMVSREIGRQFKELSVTPTNRQTTSSRFPSEDARSDLRKLLPWRCNLTALAQSHDYYLVACAAEVEVYKPTFPAHGLPGQLSWVVDLPKSSPGITGTIDALRPHSVNYLIIDYLGNKEVVLVACDDGDVLGYYIDDIHLQILQSGENRGGRNPNDYRVRPFFHKNVGMSAWGLAIHSVARMIAVSSNTHRLVVYWFGLDGNDMIHRKEKRLELPDSGENLPTVNFCNTGDDPDGEWLLSGSIGNWMMVWNTRTATLYKKAQLAFCKDRKLDGSCACGGKSAYPHAIWGTYWLDRRSFRRINPPSFSKALGLQKRDFSDKDFPTDFWDISASRKEVIDASERYDGRANFANVQAPMSPVEDVSDDDDDGAYSDADSTLSDDLGTDMADDGSASDIEPSMSGGAGGPASSVQYHEHPMQDHNTELVDPMSDWFTPARPLQRSLDGSIPFLEIIPPSRSNVEQMLFPPEAPILHLSSKDIFIMQPQVAKISSKRPPFHNKRQSMDAISEFDHKNYYPVVGAHDPLFQEIKSAIAPTFYSHVFSQTDRMNLHAFIPDLGVICIASGKGRVAVCTLTQMDVFSSGARLKKLRESNADAKLQARYAGWEGTKTVYGFRLDHILPFASQEEKCERPEHILIGIAVGPIPGSGWQREPGHTPSGLHGNGCKRWRLILTWMNHSILSYEIRRGEEDEGVQILSL